MPKLEKVNKTIPPEKFFGHFRGLLMQPHSFLRHYSFQIFPLDI